MNPLTPNQWDQLIHLLGKIVDQPGTDEEKVAAVKDEVRARGQEAVRVYEAFLSLDWEAGG